MRRYPFGVDPRDFNLFDVPWLLRLRLQLPDAAANAGALPRTTSGNARASRSPDGVERGHGLLNSMSGAP
jgi:hypothetical protein